MLRAGTVMLRHPRNSRRERDPERIAVTLVEAIEADPPEGAAALHWRLLTTMAAPTEAEAADIVRLYRLRWRIEQTFRMLKTHGLQIEEAQTAEPHRLFNLAALAIGAAVGIIQLVDARNGGQCAAGQRRRQHRADCRRRGAVSHAGGAKPSDNATTIPPARWPGSAGSSPGWAAGTATTSRPDPRPCATDGSDSPQSPKASRS